MHVDHVTVHSTNGIPTGLEYRHRCMRCNREFTSESVGRTISNCFVGMLMLGFATILADLSGPTESSSGTNHGGFVVAGVLGLIGLGLLAMVVMNTVALVRSPVVRPGGDPRR